jgi:hypothetical protein
LAEIPVHGLDKNCIETENTLNFGKSISIGGGEGGISGCPFVLKCLVSKTNDHTTFFTQV